MPPSEAPVVVIASIALMVQPDVESLPTALEAIVLGDVGSPRPCPFSDLENRLMIELNHVIEIIHDVDEEGGDRLSSVQRGADDLPVRILDPAIPERVRILAPDRIDVSGVQLSNRAFRGDEFTYRAAGSSLAGSLVRSLFRCMV